MARIYNPEPYGNQFQSSAQSRGFNPEAAIDRSGQEREKARQAVQNIQTEQQALGRVQQLERGQMALERSELSLQQGVERANMQARNSTINGLLKLSGSLANSYKELDGIKRGIDQENSTLEALGLDFNNPGVNQTDFLDNQTDQQEINSQSSAVNSVASEVEAGGAISDVSVANQVRQSSASVMLSGIKGNVMSARASYPLFLQEALNQIPESRKPKTLPEAQSLIRDLNRQFFRASGLYDPKLRGQIASQLAPTILDQQSRAAVQLVQQGVKADRAANLSQLSSNIYNAVNGNASAEEVWATASDGYANNNVGYNGRNAGSNEAAITALAKQAGAVGDDKLLEDLYNTPKIPGQPNGPTLGDEYGHILGPAIKSAAATRRGEIKAQRDEVNIQKDLKLQKFYEGNASVEERQKLVEELRAMPQTKAVRDSIDNLTKYGANYDPQLELSLQERASRGDYIGGDELKEYLDNGSIRPEVYKQHARSNEEIQNEVKVKDFLKSVDDQFPAAILNGAAPQMSAAQKESLNLRSVMMSRDAKNRLINAASANPELLDDPVALQAEFSKIITELREQPQYQVDINAGKPFGFKGEPLTEAAGDVAAITVAPGEQNFSRLSSGAVFKNFPLSEINASDDFILSPTTLELNVKSILEGGEVTPRVSSFARRLGMSDRALIEAQLQRYGKPSVALLQQQALAGKDESPDDLTADSGYNFIANTLGVPSRGAAYLTSAISHESSWNGMRQWGEVPTPEGGDGTNRNGGLVSWASWHNDSARLGAIERHFGRNISKITEKDQLDYMLNVEMKRAAYSKYRRVFMNPNASSADLRWAVSGYWGFDPRFTGNRWVDAEALIGSRK